MKLQVRGREAYAYTGGKTFDASLPCVVFIHGAMHDHSVWGLQSRALAHRRFSVLAVDLPGHNRSAGPASASVEDAARWVIDLMEAAGVQRAALVGHSMGSLIALEAASQLGDRATHLALLATACPMKVSPDLLATATADPFKAIDMVNAWSHSTIAAKPSAPAPGFWLHGTNRALGRRLLSAYAAAGLGNLFAHDFKVCDAYAVGLQSAARVRCPAVVIAGNNDRMTSPKAAAELIRVLEADCMPLNAGHALMTETPAGVFEALVSLLAKAHEKR